MSKEQTNVNRCPIKVTNVCGKFSLSYNSYELRDLASKIHSSSYNPKRFPAVIIKRCNPKATVLFFRTGKGIIIGASGIQDIEIVAKKFAKIISSVTSNTTKVVDASVTNIAAVASLGYEINIGHLMQNRKSMAHQSMPGVIFKLGQPIKQAIIYKSGQIILTGVTEISTLFQAYEKLKNLMIEYKLDAKLLKPFSECEMIGSTQSQQSQ